MTNWLKSVALGGEVSVNFSAFGCLTNLMYFLIVELVSRSQDRVALPLQSGMSFDVKWLS